MKKLLLSESTFPGDLLEDLWNIRSILLHYGAVKIILYGSLARGDYRPNSDIDICVEGLPDQNYFRALAECLMKARHSVSVLDFKNVWGQFRERILQEGKILYERE